MLCGELDCINVLFKSCFDADLYTDIEDCAYIVQISAKKSDQEGLTLDPLDPEGLTLDPLGPWRPTP